MVVKYKPSYDLQDILRRKCLITWETTPQLETSIGTANINRTTSKETHTCKSVEKAFLPIKLGFQLSLKSFISEQDTFLLRIKVRKKAKIRNRYNDIPHLTQDTIWESDKTQENITYKRAKRPALSQQVTTRHDSMNDKHETQIHKRSESFKVTLVSPHKVKL